MYNFRDLRNVHLNIIFYLIFQDEEELKDPLSAQLEDQKAIVFLSTLLQLLTLCHLSGCSSVINALLASYCLTCGLHISQVRDKINNLMVRRMNNKNMIKTECVGLL